MRLLIFSLVVVAMLAGCAQPALHADRSAPPLPAQWTHAAHVAEDRVTSDWWRGFGSAELDVLVQTAQAQSLDVAAATARMRQAEAQVRMAPAIWLPAVTGAATVAREGRAGGRASVAGSAYSIGVSVSYELDIWGGQRSERDAALAASRASVFARDAVQLTVTAAVADAWLQAVALRQRVEIARLNLHSAERLLNLVEARARAGAATPLELAQQRGLVANQKRSIDALRQQAEDARTTVATLLGQAGPVAIATATLQGLALPSTAAGLPAELLLRRPDIARAEAQLTAADANVSVARAAMLPSLTLNGGMRSGGGRLSNLLDNPIYSLAAALAAPIFDGGRLAAGRDLAQAQREELLANYRQAVVAAFADVDMALNAVTMLEAQVTDQMEELRQARRAMQLAEARYRAGADTLLTLLDAQRALYGAQDIAVQLASMRLRVSIGLYKALGGGWRVPTAPSQPETE